ncbi:MAG: hypothetical protein H6732_06195 [Alphaproteobacteria bacterium]|nr:hypothetical protein [Alphaproteobacteria bacterium]
MTRLSITLLHSALAISALTGAVIVLLVGRACLAWDLGFYASVGETSVQWFVFGLITTAFSLGQLVGAWAWFAGQRWGGIALLAATGVLVLAAPVGVALLLLVVGLMIAADLMVMARREALDPPGG